MQGLDRFDLSQNLRLSAILAEARRALIWVIALTGAAVVAALCIALFIWL